MASGNRFPRRFVDNCNDNDVIFGRGKGSYNNPGNKHLQIVIRQHFPQYDIADLQTKNILAHKVVDVMTNKTPSSRFLKAEKDANRWYEMTREEVVKKIKQDFANLKSAHKRKIEDDEQSLHHNTRIPERKRPAIGAANSAKPTAVSSSVMEQLSAIDGSEVEISNEVSAIMAVVNQVFVHNPRLDHQKQADMILGDDAVKEAILSILEFKAEQYAAVASGRTSIISPHARRIRGHGSSSGNSSRMPTVGGLIRTGPSVKIDVAQMERVCEKVRFDPKMEEINNITPKLRVKDDRTYSGSVMNSSPHGIGFMKFDDGRIYCGAWHKGKLHGNACVLYKNGDRYVGAFDKNKRTGEGVCYYNDGSIYQGTFEDDKLNGKGAYRSRDGNVYEGDFVNGNFQGQGTHQRFDGTKQTGRFENWSFVSSSTEQETPATEPTAHDADDSKEDEPPPGGTDKKVGSESDAEKDSHGSNTEGEKEQEKSPPVEEEEGTDENHDDQDAPMEENEADDSGSDKGEIKANASVSEEIL